MTRRTGPGPAGQMSLFVPSREREGLPETAAPPRPEPGETSVADMWQVHGTYIFAQTRGGVLIIDQHSAHERVLYEDVTRTLRGGTAGSQRLLFPISLALAPDERAVVEELRSLFARVGYEIDLVADGIELLAVPQPHPHFDAARCLRDVLAELARGSDLVDPARNQHERLALSFACKGSIRAGQLLTQREMAELFDRLFATELPYQDVHGRPTVVHLPLADLQSRFRP